MNTQEEYNGWSNYETWLVNLNLSNDEMFYQLYERVSSVEALKVLWMHAKGFFTDSKKVNEDLVNWTELFEHVEEDQE